MRYYSFLAILTLMLPSASYAVEVKSVQISCYSAGSGNRLVDGPELEKVLKAIGRYNQDGPACKDLSAIKRIPTNELGHNLLCKCIL